MDTLIVKTVVYGVLKTPRALHVNPLHSSKIGVWIALSRRLKRQLLRKIIQIFYSVSLFCWKSINGISGFSNLDRPLILRKQQLSCRVFSVIALFVMAFGPHDPQTVRHLTSFCVDFLKTESTTITQETWRTVNLTLDGGGGVVKGMHAYHQEVGGHFQHLL